MSKLVSKRVELRPGLAGLDDNLGLLTALWEEIQPVAVEACLPELDFLSFATTAAHFFAIFAKDKPGKAREQSEDENKDSKDMKASDTATTVYEKSEGILGKGYWADQSGNEQKSPPTMEDHHAASTSYQSHATNPGGDMAHYRSDFVDDSGTKRVKFEGDVPRSKEEVLNQFKNIAIPWDDEEPSASTSAEEMRTDPVPRVEFDNVAKKFRSSLHSGSSNNDELSRMITPFPMSKGKEKDESNPVHGRDAFNTATWAITPAAKEMKHVENLWENYDPNSNIDYSGRGYEDWQGRRLPRPTPSDWAPVETNSDYLYPSNGRYHSEGYDDGPARTSDGLVIDDSPKLIGFAYLTESFHVAPSVSGVGELNIGVIIEKTYRERGYATEAVKLMIPFALGPGTKCHRVQASLMKTEFKDVAMSIFTQQGFSHEGTRRRAFYSGMEMEWKDVTTLAILDTDYELRELLNPAPKSLWDEMFTRHEKERQDLLRWDERRMMDSSSTVIRRTSSMETIRRMPMYSESDMESEGEGSYRTPASSSRASIDPDSSADELEDEERGSPKRRRLSRDSTSPVPSVGSGWDVPSSPSIGSSFSAVSSNPSWSDLEDDSRPASRSSSHHSFPPESDSEESSFGSEAELL